MDIYQRIKDYSEQPLTHQLLMDIIGHYKRPNDKIRTLKAEGIIESIKKGLYVAGPKVTHSKPANALLASHIYGPSNLSLDSALSYYGLIPERVYEITSTTSKASKEFTTPVGTFTYRHLPLPYYAFGLKMVEFSNNQRAIMACPEKALCDKIVTTSGIILRSVTQTANYLLEDLRIDEAILKTLDINMIESWLSDAPKRDSLELLIKLIKRL